MMLALFAPLAPFLALVLAVAAVHKMIARDRLAAAAARLTGAPVKLGPALRTLAAALEAIAAGAILMPVTRPAGALAAIALWTVYTALLLTRSADGKGAFDCGCSFTPSFPVAGWGFPAGRPLLLAGLALIVAILPPQGLAIEPACAALAFFSLYLAAGEFAALPRSRRSLAQ